MFLINQTKNEAVPLEKKSFTELSFSERNHLQEWIDKSPEILGEKLLIIQKEFDGFSDTQERLDLLALDKEKRLVVIENKLDSSGKDVVWQSMKYASYCATLNASEIRDIYQSYLDRYKGGGDAVQNISDFYGEDDVENIIMNESNSSQRIILVAANFRKEVTSTVLWLQNFGLDIKCVRVTPYQFEGQVFLDTEQILPTPETEEYRIRLGIKSQENRQVKEETSQREKMLLNFWTAFVEYCKSIGRDVDIARRKPLARSSYDITLAQPDYHVLLTISHGNTLSVGLYIRSADAFNRLESKKDAIEAAAGFHMDWQVSRPDSINKQIRYSIITEPNDSEKYKENFSWLVEHFDKLKTALASVDEA